MPCRHERSSAAIVAAAARLCNATVVSIFRYAMTRRFPPIATGLALIGVVLMMAGCATAARPPDDPAVAPDPEAEPTVESPLTIPEVYDAISVSVQAGDPETAIAAFRQAELDDPDDPATLVLLANLYLIAGLVGEAEGLVDDVLADDPDNRDALYLLSLLRSVQGRTADQRALLERVVADHPDFARAHASLGELQLQSRDLRAAETSFRAALASDPRDLVGLIGLGNVYLRQSRHAEAEAELTAAIDVAPDFSFAYSDRARARALQYKLDSAEADLTIALELDPDFYWHLIDRGRVRMETRRFRAAIEDFTRAIEIDPDQFLAYALRAQALDAEEQYDAAISDFETALAMRRDYEPAFVPVATLYYMFDRHADAARYYRMAFDRHPRRFDFALMAALAMKSDGRNPDAVRYLQDILGRVPRDSLYYHVVRYYIQPSTETLVLSQLREERDATMKARMYFFVGAQLELLGRTQTAQASFMHTEAELQPGFLEHRLALWRLRSYRSDQGAR